MCYCYYKSHDKLLSCHSCQCCRSKECEWQTEWRFYPVEAETTQCTMQHTFAFHCLNGKILWIFTAKHDTEECERIIGVGDENRYCKCKLYFVLSTTFNGRSLNLISKELCVILIAQNIEIRLNTCNWALRAQPKWCYMLFPWENNRLTDSLSHFQCDLWMCNALKVIWMNSTANRFRMRKIIYLPPLWSEYSNIATEYPSICADSR